MVGFFSAGVRAVLHSLKDLVDALLDPIRHKQLNSLTGTVSAAFLCCHSGDLWWLSAVTLPVFTMRL